MVRRIIFILSWLLISGSLLYPQSLMNRLRVPIASKWKMGIGYDNNYLRLSDKEIREDDVQEYGISSTLDSPIMKPTVKLIYSPIIVNDKTTNIITSFSYSYFSQAVQKSYLITNISMELKLRSYSWIKIGIRDIPKYYLRNYHDRDLSNIDYYGCSFSSQKYFASYSLPIKRLSITWMKVYADYTKEYYNPHFTEFDLNKWMLKIDMNHRFKNKHKIKLSVAHGSAKNISYESYLASTSFDRSYIFDKLRSEFVYKNRNDNMVKRFGISILLEQRYYELESSKYSFDNWKYYLDGRTKLWAEWNVMDAMGIRTWYQYRWRNADTQLYGDFGWVEDIKSYSKHEIWLELSYEVSLDILY